MFLFEVNFTKINVQYSMLNVPVNIRPPLSLFWPVSTKRNRLQPCIERVNTATLGGVRTAPGSASDDQHVFLGM